MNVSGIIQVRTGSTRLPNKVMYKIKDKTLLELYIDRVKHSKLLNEIIVATTINPNDDAIVDLIKEKYGNEIKIYRGSEEDVLDRYYQCARDFKSDIVVRLTPDDAFVDPDIIDGAIITMADKKCDFVTNHFHPTFPEGLDIEVYQFPILAYIWYKSKLKSEREHVFTYIYNNRSLFHVINFESPIDYSEYRWTVDHKEDVDLVRKIYELMEGHDGIFKMYDILGLYKIHPELKDINSGIKRKEGVNKTIVADGGKPI